MQALAEHALRYFTGHGPATERDLAYWATLTVTDVRAGGSRCVTSSTRSSTTGRTFWHAPAEAPLAPQQPAGHLLQILDEMYRGYQDSGWVLDAGGHVPRTREAVAGMAMWTRRLSPPCGVSSPTTMSSSISGRIEPWRAPGS